MKTEEEKRLDSDMAELDQAAKSAKYCFACVGDGWLSGEWDTCPHCYGTGRTLTDEERRIYRCRKAERESRASAKRLDAAEAEHAKNMAELAAAQEALFGAGRA
jgi:RecJ-like exonuclease